MSSEIMVSIFLTVCIITYFATLLLHTMFCSEKFPVVYKGTDKLAAS